MLPKIAPMYGFMINPERIKSAPKRIKKTYFLLTSGFIGLFVLFLYLKLSSKDLLISGVLFLYVFTGFCDISKSEFFVD